jgi:hypothetical protein
MALKLKKVFEDTQQTIYLDMDGVLTDFAKAFKNTAGFDVKDSNVGDNDSVYIILQNVSEEFWSKMAWMPDGKELWNYVKKLNVVICSTPIDNDACRVGKRKWCRDNLGAQIKVILTAEKEKYANPNNILIDDREKVIKKWVKAGGISILHKNAKDTIKQLKKILE